MTSVNAAMTTRTPGVLARAKWRMIAYWAITLFIVYENLAGSIWDLLRITYVRVDLAHLGYPAYLFHTVLGPGEFLCAVALLIPGFATAKEWAYAGSTLKYSAALASHLAVGDRAGIWVLPLICLVLALASWVLGLPERRARKAPRLGRSLGMAWLVPLALLVAFTILGFLTLPSGTMRY